MSISCPKGEKRIIILFLVTKRSDISWNMCSKMVWNTSPTILLEHWKKLRALTLFGKDPQMRFNFWFYKKTTTSTDTKTWKWQRNVENLTQFSFLVFLFVAKTKQKKKICLCNNFAGRKTNHKTEQQALKVLLYFKQFDKKSFVAKYFFDQGMGAFGWGRNFFNVITWILGSSWTDFCSSSSSDSPSPRPLYMSTTTVCRSSSWSASCLKKIWVFTYWERGGAKMFVFFLLAKELNYCLV